MSDLARYGLQRIRGSDVSALARYGLQWNGPQEPVATPLPDGYWTPWHDANSEIERLRARLAEAERDAARYRWLRTAEANWYCDGDRLTFNHTPAIDTGFGRTLDQAIDIAMRAADSASPSETGGQT